MLRIKRILNKINYYYLIGLLFLWLLKKHYEILKKEKTLVGKPTLHLHNNKIKH